MVGSGVFVAYLVRAIVLICMNSTGGSIFSVMN